MTPAEQHAAVLASLAMLEKANHLADRAPWRLLEAPWSDSPGAARSWDVETDLGYWELGPGGEWNARLTTFLRDGATAMLAGKRRTLERHPPVTVTYGYDLASMAQCRSCAEKCHSSSGVRCDDPIDGAWPCDDWRDAAAGLPNLPEGIVR